MQDSHTSDMIFTVAQIIEWLSDNMALRPGTLIMTGNIQDTVGTRPMPSERA